MRRFELVDGKSEKFWEIAVEAASFTVRYGRIGAAGQTQTKSFATDAKAAAEAAKLVKEKTGKGYVEVAASGPPRAATTTATTTSTTTATTTATAAATTTTTTTSTAPTTATSTAAAAITPATATAASGTGREAPASALPRVLASPPWLSKAKAKAKTVLQLETLARPHTFAWKPGELERYRNHYRPSDAESAGILEDMKRKVAEHGERVSPYIDSWWCTMRMVDAHMREAWESLPMVVWRANTALYVLARLGDDALPKYVDYALSLRQPTTSSVLLPLVSPRVAAIMSDGFAGRRSRADAEEWLRAHPEMAAVGLVPEAVGDGKSRENAGAALRFLVGRGHGERVRAVAREYGAAAEAAVAEVLAVDPADSFPAKLPKLPAFFAPEALPRPRLKSGDALPLTAVTALATMLAFSSPEAPYAGIAQVKEACDPASLDAFAWGIYEAWSKAGAPSKEQWALFAVGYLGGDASARKLTPLIRQWPGAALHARAVLGLEVLALIGSDIALLNLQGVAEKVKFKALQERAQEKIAQITENRGLTTDELADRLAPDLDLDPDGSKVLDFGARTFRVGFSEALKPWVKTATGDRLADLPKPNKSDDAAKAKLAVEAWKLLKQDARQVAATQIFRLEKAMCAERRWDAPTFRTFLVEHPLVRHLTCRLVWGTYDASGALLTTFRVAEDGTFATVEDRAFELPADARVGLPHVLHLPADLVRAWGERFAEYELLPPFAQLTREVFRPTPEEADSSAIARVEGRTVPTSRVIGLLGRGWSKGAPQDAGWIWEWLKALPGHLEPARLHLETGVLAAGMGEEPEQKLGGLTLPATARELSPVVFSELMRDLATLTEA